MDSLSDDEHHNGRTVVNQPYDESIEVPDAEEVASVYNPTPRVPGLGSRGEPALGESRASRGNSPPNAPMSDGSEDEFETGAPKPMPFGQGRANPNGKAEPLEMGDRKRYDEEDDSGSDEDDDDDDDDDENGGAVEGAYDPSDYENLPVTSDIKELFSYITRYTPQSIELDHKLRPFIPDFIPAVGDIDAFIKVPRPDSKPDQLGLSVLDEPCARQSDPTVLDLTLRSISKQTTVKQVTVKSIENAERNPKAVDNWIDSISELHRSKPPPNVHYTKNMPDIDNLMQEWPPEFEELLKEISLPSADLDCDLSTYVEIICGLLDIPIYKSKIQSLHVLFTLFSEFKNSQHFRSLADSNQLDNALKAPEEDADRLVI
ncbi:hypothetical protein CAPTEDRAFT_181738 [Capitella teleta]|uniref:Intraflagellar transport protein 46 homolog n=1 Tax=Capitella teleta TaxID=283909 RepID=R7UK87_CAPTE|nr:hypothetical protein CAPTEDRAFT_181738 [Capitella teleta]|eukprot:ELU06595.1 hypothetical protein CAPTEDRAFT_181738 [Capitella teleta]